jgi:hypothetical protein
MHHFGIFIGAIAAIVFAGATLAHEESRPKAGWLSRATNLAKRDEGEAE